MTLDEFFKQNESRKLLVKNLETNNRVFLGNMSEGEVETLLRMNLIMIRQAIESELNS